MNEHQPGSQGHTPEGLLRALRYERLRVQRSKEPFLNDEEFRKASCRESNLSLFLENVWYFSYSD